jgi:hypothetical protein
MAPPLIVRAVLDAVGYLKVSESVVASNTLMGDSALGMGADFTKSAEAQVAAGAKVIASQRAQLTQLKAIQAEAIAGSDRRIAADVAVAKAQAVLARSTGGTVLATGALSSEAKTAERDIGKLTRGALAGSGVFAKLGRSLAFASTGFIAVAGGATVIAESIRQAEDLAAAQRQVDRQLQTSGKSWSQYGGTIDKVLLKEGHLAGFTRAQLLQAFGYLLRVGGNVQRSLNLTALAADVARGRSISLQAASIALSKALGGSATALRRLGIIVPNNVTKMQALEYVQKKFAGQAEAGTTSSARLSAALTDAGATIGTVVLPTFERLTTHFGDWLNRMNESGKLTHDFGSVVSFLGVGFHTLEGAIRAVDDVTGSFGHTLLVIGEIWAGIKIAAWIGTLEKVAISWGLIQSAAEKAAVAEAAAASVSAAGIATGDLRAAALASEGAGGASLLSRLVPRGVGGAIGLGVGGLIAGQIAGAAGAPQPVSSSLTGAGVGAGIGTLIEPGVGTAVGAGVGALAGALASLIHQGPSVQQTLEADAAAMKNLDRAAHEAALSVTGIRLQRLQLQDTLATQRATVAADRGAVARTTPGTPAHAAAARQLREDQLALLQTEQQLKVTTDQLTGAEQKQARIRQQRQKTAAGETKQIIDLAASYSHLAASLGKGPVTSSKDIDTLMQSVKDGTDKATNSTDMFIQKLDQIAAKSSPGLQGVLKKIQELTEALGHIPSSKEIRIIFKGQGDFRVGPGGDLFPTGPRSVPAGPSRTQPAGPPPPVVWTGFQLTLNEQIKQVQASMTKTLADDVKLAREIIARIKRLIDIGNLVPGTKGYLAALQEQASAEAVLQSAEAQKAEQRRAAAEKARELASTYSTPIDLQIAQVQAEMTKSNKDDIAVLRKIIAAARRTLAQGGKNKQGRLAVLQTILQAQEALQSLLGTGADSPLVPLKLQLALAKAQALGTNQTPILKRMKAALEKALKAAHGNIQRQIDIWNQIASINQQLGQSITNSYGKYKKASLKWETEGLGLTPAQRRALEAKLSQIGPGGTHPMSGTGAAGYVIDPDTGRPIDRHHRRRQGSQYAGSGGGRPPTVNANIDLRVYIDGKQVEATVTKRQQKSNTHRPTQRRGPLAATR